MLSEAQAGRQAGSRPDRQLDGQTDSNRPTNLHGCSSETISQLCLQFTASLIDFGSPVFELMCLIKYANMPWYLQHVLQIQPAQLMSTVNALNA